MLCTSSVRYDAKNGVNNNLLYNIQNNIICRDFECLVSIGICTSLVDYRYENLKTPFVPFPNNCK